MLLGRLLIDLTPMEGKFDDIKENYVFSQWQIEKWICWKKYEATYVQDFFYCTIIMKQKNRPIWLNKWYIYTMEC